MGLQCCTATLLHPTSNWRLVISSTTTATTTTSTTYHLHHCYHHLLLRLPRPPLPQPPHPQPVPNWFQTCSKYLEPVYLQRLRCQGSSNPALPLTGRKATIEVSWASHETDGRKQCRWTQTMLVPEADGHKQCWSPRLMDTCIYIWIMSYG